MAIGNEPVRTDKIHAWVQTLAIIVATGWGAYTFMYKEIMLPKAAPINITLDLQLRKIEGAKREMQHESKALVAVEVHVSATNSSSREVFMLPSAWIAVGVKVNAMSGNLEFSEQGVSPLILEQGSQFEKYSVSSRQVVAMGSLLEDNGLKPHETSKRTLIFNVPTGMYDYIELEAMIPTMGKQNGVDLEWKFEKKTQNLVPIMYWVSKNGEHSLMQEDKDGGYLNPKLEFQMATNRQTLSLWQ